MMKVLVGVVIVAFIVIVGFLVIDPDLEGLNSGNSNSITEVSNQQGSKYTIEGEVYKAGTYVLSDGITMGDLLEAAGGTTANADDLAYFTNATLKAGSFQK